MIQETYKVDLADLFEGPLELLVHLIKKNEVSIYDIPIARITDQYLAYIEWMKAMNIDIAGDFIVMAATLTQIKSRLLLPFHDNEEDEEEILAQITGPLEEYLQIKYTAEQLEQRVLLGEDTFKRTAPSEVKRELADEETIQVGLFELIDAFKRILDNLSPDMAVDLTADTITVKDRISQIVDLLEAEGSVTFDDLFSSDATRSDIVVTFLAVLEMVKLQVLKIRQHINSGIIRLFYQ